MSITWHNELEQLSPEWFEIRRGKLTSSETGNYMGILGLGKTGEHYALAKAWESMKGIDLSDNFDNIHMRRGRELEPLAIQKIKSDNPLNTFQEFGFVENMRYPGQGTSPDLIMDMKVNYEIKCPAWEKWLKIVSNPENIDKGWLLQIQHQMMIMELDVTILAFYTVYNNEEYIYYHKVNKVPETIKLIEERSNQVINLINKNKKEVLCKFK